MLLSACYSEIDTNMCTVTSICANACICVNACLCVNVLFIICIKNVIFCDRSNHAFLYDVLDRLIYSAANEYLGITLPDDNPTKNKPPPIVRRLVTPQEQTMWAYEVASSIRKAVCSVDCLRKYILHLRNQVSVIYERDGWIDSTRLSDHHCPAINCNKSYKKKSKFTKHVCVCHENLSSFVQKPVSDVSNELDADEQNSLVLILLLI